MAGADHDDVVGLPHSLFLAAIYLSLLGRRVCFWTDLQKTEQICSQRKPRKLCDIILILWRLNLQQTPPLDPSQFPPEQWARLSALIDHMRHDGTQRTDPMREIFARLGDRWSMLLLQILRSGPMRSGLLRRVTGRLSAEGKLSQRIFTLQMRTLENDGLVRRTVIPTNPISVDYALTPLGASLLDEVDRVMAWIRGNIPRFPVIEQKNDSGGSADDTPTG
jgi:DNA-binding HxlR family transcriptional regulator